VIVQGPNGATVQFPDGTPDDVVNKAMMQAFAPKYDPATDPTSSQAFKANEVGGFWQNLLPGIGQGMSDVAKGAQQLGMHIMERDPTVRLLGGAGTVSDAAKQIDKEVNDKAAIDKHLEETGGGKVGATIGQVAATLPVARMGITPAAGAPLLNVLSTGANAGLQGGILGALQPTQTQDDVSSLVKGEQPASYWDKKVGQIDTGGLTGLATGTLLGGATEGIRKLLSPSSTAVNAAVGKSADTPFAKEGEALAQRTGIDLTPGQVTGSKTQTQLENLARQSVFSRSTAFQADQKIIGQWNDYVSGLIDNIGEGGGSAEIGQRVQGAVKQATSDLTNARDVAAQQDYGAIRNLLQGKPAVVPQNYLQKIQELGQEFAGGPEGSDYAKLSRTLSSLQENGLQNADLQTLMKTRRFLSQVAGGQVNLAGETGKGLQKSVASQLLGAIDQDLDASAQKIGGPVGDMLQQANARYRGFSQQIEGLQNSALGKLVGEDFANAMGSGQFNSVPGEVVMQRLSQLKPSQLEAAKGILQDKAPDVWQSVKRSYLEDALSKAQASAPSEGANALVARPNVFVSALDKTPEARQRLQAMFSSQEQSQINDALSAARRISDKTGMNFSGTASAAEGYGLMHAIGSLASGNPAPAAGMLSGGLTTRSIANLMLNADGRALVTQLDRLPPGTDRFNQVLAQITALSAAQNVGQGTQQP